MRLTKGKRRGSSHSDLHPYQRCELWANGTLAFYLNSATHNTAAYLDFHQRQQAEAGRLGKT
jgi:hypothetical protein